MFSILHISFITCASIVMSHILIKRHVDFRERFLERQRQRQIKDRKLVMAKDAVVKNIEVLDEITHHRKIGDMSSAKWVKTISIENDFRRLLAMNDMKYTYKRDMHWRTWRSVAVGSKKKVVCYKCNNLQVNGTGGHNCGMWMIEARPPPCPYEFFSVVSDTDLCGVKYTQYSDLKSTCPSIIKFSDLTATCDNPIETEYEFSKMYGVTENYDSVICNGKDYCDIFTMYEITPQHVIFRIVNSTNDVMYSRIMKPNNNNYVCVDDCGRYNPNTRRVTKSDKPLKLNLFSLRKSEQEEPLNEMNDGIPFATESILSVPSLETKMPVSKNGGIELDLNENIGEHKIASRVIKRHQANSDFDKYSSHINEISLEDTNSLKPVIS